MMTYTQVSSMRKTAEDNPSREQEQKQRDQQLHDANVKGTMQQLRQSQVAKPWLDKVSPGQLTATGAGAIAGGIGGYLLSNLIHKKPKLWIRALYALGGALAGGVGTYAALGSVTGNNGLTLRDSWRLTNAINKDKDIKKTFDQRVKGKTPLMSQGAFGVRQAAMTALPNLLLIKKDINTAKQISNANATLQREANRAVQRNNVSAFQAKYKHKPGVYVNVAADGTAKAGISNLGKAWKYGVPHLMASIGGYGADLFLSRGVNLLHRLVNNRTFDPLQASPAPTTSDSITPATQQARQGQ